MSKGICSSDLLEIASWSPHLPSLIVVIHARSIAIMRTQTRASSRPLSSPRLPTPHQPQNLQLHAPSPPAPPGMLAHQTGHLQQRPRPLFIASKIPPTP